MPHQCPTNDQGRQTARFGNSLSSLGHWWGIRHLPSRWGIRHSPRHSTSQGAPVIDTLANVKSALFISGTTDDAVLIALMDAADTFIAVHTGRDFAGGTFTETHPAGRAVVFARNFPITSV